MQNPRVLDIPDDLERAFPSSKRYLAGISGGRDSIALLHLLWQHGYRKLIVCHLDHQLRGRAARSDARFVQSIARRYGFVCELGSANVQALAAKTKLSIETAARSARLGFFCDVARRRRCRTIFLGHHADDLVETVLLNLFRGGSPGRLGSMRAVANHRIGRTELTIVRPLLKTWRAEIDAYAEQQNLRFREDASNAELSSARNRIRHKILPYIEKQFGRGVRKSIWRAAQIWIEEEALLNSAAEKESLSGEDLEVGRLRASPLALQRRIIHRWLTQRDIAEVSFDLVESVRGLLNPGAPSARVNLPGSRYVRRRAKRIFIE